MHKAISYAFPTSALAKRMNRSAQGCYVVEVSTHYRNPNPSQTFGPFETVEAAERHAAEIIADWSPYTQRAAA